MAKGPKKPQRKSEARTPDGEQPSGRGQETSRFLVSTVIRQLRRFMLAAVLPALSNTAFAQGVAPNDFELRAAYCLGARTVLAAANSHFTCEQLAYSPDNCKKMAQLNREMSVDLDRLRTYVAIHIIDSPDPLPYLIAEKHGQVDAGTLLQASVLVSSSCEQASDMTACLLSYLKKTNPLAADAAVRVLRCQTVVKELPF